MLGRNAVLATHHAIAIAVPASLAFLRSIDTTRTARTIVGILAAALSRVAAILMLGRNAVLATHHAIAVAVPASVAVRITVCIAIAV